MQTKRRHASEGRWQGGFGKKVCETAIQDQFIPPDPPHTTVGQIGGPGPGDLTQRWPVEREQALY